MKFILQSLPMLVAAATECAAQSPIGKGPLAIGELWSVESVHEFYEDKQRTPARREDGKKFVCHYAGSVNVQSAANSELPATLKEKCWLTDKRSEAQREQTKFSCNDGMTIEVATRVEKGGFGSQVAINVPGSGGIVATHTMRRVAGSCNPTKRTASPSVLAPTETPK